MQNRQGTLIGIGALAIACLGYFYVQYRQERSGFKQKQRELQERCKAVTLGDVNLKRIKQKGEKQFIFFPEVNKYILNEGTFKKFIRRRHNRQIAGRTIQSFRQNQSGGSFQFVDPSTQEIVKVEINDCNIEEEALEEKIQKCIVFPEQNKHKRSEYSSLTYLLKAGKRLALFGTIGYSITEGRFVMQPEFIALSEIDAQKTIGKLAQFWQEKIYRATFWKMLLTFSIGAVGYMFIYHPLRSAWKRYRQKFGEVSAQKLSHFGGKKQFLTRIDSKLICEVCKVNNVKVIYECGHLCICDDCHIANASQRCPICNKVSTQSIKIFL